MAQEPKNETISTKVTKTTLKKLKKIAKDEDRKVSYILNQVVAKFVSESVK